MAFATPALGAPIRNETRFRPLLRDVPVRAVQNPGSGPKAAPKDWTPLMGLIESPLHRHGCHCVHSRPGRRLDFGPALPRAGHVPFLPFLPAPTVFSAEVRPESRTLDSVRVCCTPQPVLEFATFPTPGWPHGRPRPEGLFEVFLSGVDPSKRFPLRQPDQSSPPIPPHGGPSVHRLACPLAVDRIARRRVTTPSCTDLDLRALFRRRVRCDRGVLPPHVARCSHGL